MVTEPHGRDPFSIVWATHGKGMEGKGTSDRFLGVRDPLWSTRGSQQVVCVSARVCVGVVAG